MHRRRSRMLVNIRYDQSNHPGNVSKAAFHNGAYFLHNAAMDSLSNQSEESKLHGFHPPRAHTSNIVVFCELFQPHFTVVYHLKLERSTLNDCKPVQLDSSVYSVAANAQVLRLEITCGSDKLYWGVSHSSR
jgi:hypothetical protein